MNRKVVTRFAPSPTGNLHIGGARTALFNYLWAKKNNGTFILRIEDTDRERYMAESEKSILDGLKWLGLNWDVGPVRQSDNFKKYLECAEKLIEQGKAYYCFCTPDRLEKMREIQKQKKLAPKYDGTCRKLSKSDIEQKLINNEKFVIRLKVPSAGEIVIKDLIRGEIRFNCQEIDDQVLIKSDGFPTYHLANVIDDHEMNISHVIRGEEWIPSTPKHVLLYQAFGWEQPQFAHLSLFIKKDGGKLSKREGAVSLLSYKDLGYLPEAVVNFIAFLGWNPKSEKEFFSLSELIQEFDLTKVHKANPIFSTEKLDYFNGYYLRNKKLADFVDLCLPYLPDIMIKDKKYLTAILAVEQERIKILSEIPKLIDYFFAEHVEYDSDLLIWKKVDKIKTKNNLQLLFNKLQSIEAGDWNINNLQSIISSWIKENNLSNGEVLWPMRASLTGVKASPSPFEVAGILGKEKTLDRVQKAINLI